jgi:transcriptional regulator with XRE-family HTH domain
VKKEEILVQFGNRIRERRIFLGISQEKLAEITGFHRTYIGMVERGERNISLKNINVFANAFKLSTSQLLEGVNEC